jgi:hypothetical protein
MMTKRRQAMSYKLLTGLVVGSSVEFGIPAAKLLVYGGGITEWTANGLPIEVGARKSGQLRNANK